MRTFASLDEFAAAKGGELGRSAWHEITQEQVNAFADATGDHQWIGSKIRAAATLTDVNQTHLGSLAPVRMRVEIEGQSKAA